MIDREAINWLWGMLATAITAIVGAAVALVKRVNHQEERLSVVEVKQTALDQRVSERLDSIDDSLKGLTTFLLNNPRNHRG